MSKKKLILIAYKFWWLYYVWMRVTIFLTSFRRTRRVPLAESLTQIIGDMYYGRWYHTDPIKGRFDVIPHPGRVQYNIEEKNYLDDCDGHAIMWAARAVKSGLVERAFYCTIGMLREGEIIGHAFFICIPNGSTELHWADYRPLAPVPNGFYEVRDCFQAIADEHGAEPVAGRVYLVESVDHRGTPKFGPSEGIDLTTPRVDLDS